MNIKKIKDTLLTMIIGSLCLMGVMWYLSDVKSNGSKDKNTTSAKKSESAIIRLLPSMSSVTKESIESMLGKPKEVYKERIYTYIDKVAQYDFLIEEKVESAVVTMKDTMYISDIEELLKIIMPGYDTIKDYKKEILNGRTIIKIYDMEDYSKIEIAMRENSDIIEYVKVEY